MPHIWADRVQDTTTTTGTGAISVTGTAPIGFRTFSAVCAASDTIYYAIAHQTLDQWEVGFGTYTGTNVIARTAPIASSNGGAAVNFSAGTKNVWLNANAHRFLTPTLRIITTSQTWNRPAGCRAVIAAVQAGGGGGGGSTGNASFMTSGGGGGSGGLSIGIVDVLAISSVSVTIGAGGTAASNTAGGNGGNSSFGSHVTANGGTGGNLGTTGLFGIGGSGGTAGTGLYAIPGNAGFSGPYNSGSAGFVPSNGKGGASPFGGSAPVSTPPPTGFAFNGTAAVGFGAGGDGGISNFVAANTSGGTGAPGCAFLVEIY